MSQSQAGQVEVEAVMTKHFPGPWVDSPKVSDAIIAPNGEPNYPWAVEDYGGALVAESVEPCNKPLIKVAPDLLKALELLTPPECPIVTHHSPNCAFCFALKTIADARGENTV